MAQFCSWLAGSECTKMTSLSSFIFPCEFEWMRDYNVKKF